MLVVENLHFSVDSTPILHNLSFHLETSEIVGFVGNNGAGKTTTFELLSQCIRPTVGSITWNGEDIWSSDTYRLTMGYVPDQLPLYPNATVEDNLRYTAHLRRLNNPKHSVDELITEFELSSVATSPIRTLSKGWRQWVGIAQAWCHKPKVLLLDEPTSGLDPSGRQRFESWLRKIRSEGTTVFLSSHILSELEAVSDRILWIENGRLIESHALMWTIQCTIERPKQTLLSSLRQIDGVESIQIEGCHITLSCHPSLRAKVSSTLVEFGLLEMRRLR